MIEILDLLPETKQYRDIFRSAAANQNVMITGSKTHAWTSRPAFFPPELYKAYYSSWNHRYRMRTVTFFVVRDDVNNEEKIKKMLDEALVLLTLCGKIPYIKLLNYGANWKITSTCVIL